MDKYDKIRKRIVSLYENSDYTTQAEFAEACGIDNGNLSRFLSGKQGIGNKYLKKIADAFGLTLQALRTGCGLCGVEGNEQLDALSDDFNSKHSAVPADVPSADAPKAEDAATFKDVLQFLSAGGIDAEGKISYKGLQDLIALQKELELKDEMLRQKDDEIAFLRNLLSQGK